MNALDVFAELDDDFLERCRELCEKYKNVELPGSVKFSQLSGYLCNSEDSHYKFFDILMIAVAYNNMKKEEFNVMINKTITYLEYDNNRNEKILEEVNKISENIKERITRIEAIGNENKSDENPPNYIN